MKRYLLYTLLLFIAAVSCTNDDSVINNNSVAFVTNTIAVQTEPVTLNIAFSNPTAEAGSLTVRVTATNVENGIDFTTNPATTDEEIIIPFEAQTSNVSFTFQPLTTAIEGQQKNVVLKITSLTLGSVAIPEATSSVQVNFGESPVMLNTMTPAIGGPNLPNQVYIDLSSGMQTGVLRTNWDFAFYSGDDFRVGINGSVKMAAKQTTSNNIEQVVEIDETVEVGQDNGSGVENGNIAYTDNPNGEINSTVIEVFETDDQNNVFLVNLGYSLSGETPPIGEVSPFGVHRGWLKVRVLRDGTSYKLQYAEPQSTTYTEVIVPKTENYNYTFFSISGSSTTPVQPESAKWDLNFTVFTDHIDFGSGEVSFPVVDFVALNNLGGTRAYEQLESAGTTYVEFTTANVVAASFNTAQAADQRVIGSNWRNGAPNDLPSVREDRFYIVRDDAGNIYKLRFVALANEEGQRGNITFEYELLQ